MNKVQIFCNPDLRGLQTEINNFAENYNIVSVSVTTDKGLYLMSEKYVYVATVLYSVNK